MRTVVFTEMLLLYLSFLNAELINGMCGVLFLIFIMNALLYCH